MPRTADHDARRAQIVEGVKAFALENGLGRVTVAGAASAGGISVGLVQHYYSSKDQLLLDTFSTVREEVLARVDRASARAEKRGARIEQMMVDGLKQMLPLDKHRREEAYLVHAFAGLALENDLLREHLRGADDALVGRVVTALENGKKCGEVEPGSDTATAGLAVTSLAGGLAARLLTAPSAPSRTRAVDAVARMVTELCPGDCSHPVVTR